MTINVDIAQVAKALLGPPNPHLSGKTEWRYGNGGSLSIDLPKNVFFDHEANTGGGILDLIVRERGGTHADAERWLDFQFGASCGGEKGLDEQKINGAAHRLAAGGTAEKPWALVEKTAEWKPADKSNNSDGATRWWGNELINARELCDQRFPEIRYVVPGLIPEGVTLLASRPKIGKSWLLLQIGTAVAGGTITLVASDQPPSGDVLHLALEDNRRRLQRRLTKYFGLDRENWPKRLQIATKWKRLDQGGLQAIRDWCRSANKPALIIIDTLKKVRAPKQKGQSDYDADYEACEGLQVLAGEFGLAVIVAHHDRKMAAEDVFDTVSGTLGLTGGVDTIAIIKRRPQGTTLHIEGRDLVEMVEKAITFDRETCRWTILGNADEVHQSDQRARVLAALASATDGLPTNEIVLSAGLVSRTAADKLLLRMVEHGQILRIKRGFFGLPATTRSPRPPTAGEKREKGRSEPKSLKEQGDGDQSPDLPHLPHRLEAGTSTDPSHPDDTSDRVGDV
jgi:hypothetical protein